eukprot:2177803-Pyramimonas_sp.AAC.1
MSTGHNLSPISHPLLCAQVRRHLPWGIISSAVPTGPHIVAPRSSFAIRAEPPALACTLDVDRLPC